MKLEDVEEGSIFEWEGTFYLIPRYDGPTLHLDINNKRLVTIDNNPEVRVIDNHTIMVVPEK